MSKLWITIPVHAVYGVVTGLGGLTINKWQYWVALACMFTMDIISFHWGMKAGEEIWRKS